MELIQRRDNSGHLFRKELILPGKGDRIENELFDIFIVNITKVNTTCI